MQNLKRIVAVSVACAVLVLLLGQAQAGQAQGPQPRAPQTALGTAFSYQGQLKKNDNPYTGDCNFQFSLWDALSGGAQLGSTQSLNTVHVNGGSFAVTLDFGSQFDGSARWLGMAVQCTGDGGFTTLAPRTALAPVPYALYAANAGIASSATNATSAGYATSAGSATTAVTASIALSLTHGTIISGTGVLGLQVNTPNGNAMVGTSSNGVGVYASSTYSNAIVVDAPYGNGISVKGGAAGGLYVDAAASGVTVNSSMYGVTVNYASSNGVSVNQADWDGVFVNAAARYGVLANGGSGYSGVYGANSNINSIGVKGVANASGAVGVWGESSANTGVYGKTTSGRGVWGESVGSGYAGYFSGNVSVVGTLSKSAGSFKIDHPLDPANKYLSHSFVESPDMMNVYNGNITTNANGDATVVLPAYFEALNKDFRYQLTVVGKQWAQARVEEEIQNNQFRIKTDKPNVKVSWQVTGIRHDPYAAQHPIIVEEDKPAGERGIYLYPAWYGQGEERGFDYAHRPANGTSVQAPAAEKR